jgi:hypothetical protein
MTPQAKYYVSKSNPLTSPRKDESVKLALMTPKQREKYSQAREAKRKKAQAAQMFLCSCLLSAETHDLLQHYALEKNLTYDQAVLRAVKHAMSCFAEPLKKKKEKKGRGVGQPKKLNRLIVGTLIFLILI